ncbi:MAG: tyrosine-type recombinase/integrase [Clostridiales bacterium]|nr:tyrosine-type recombinase/integrase [Clostridiales bacterium]
MKTTDPIKDKKDVKKILGFYQKKDNYNLRNYLLIAVGLFTALRICDILLLKWSDVLTKDGKVNDRITVKEKKTGKINIIAVNKELKKALELYIEKVGDNSGYIFKGRDKTKPLHRTQAYRIVKKAANELDLKGVISPHSLRKTLGYQLYADGASPVLLMSIYNHSSFAITKRYLRISQTEKDEAFLSLSYS